MQLGTYIDILYRIWPAEEGKCERGDLIDVGSVRYADGEHVV